MTSYDALAHLAERELELVSAGSLDQLPALHQRRDALVATLPPQPPAAARPALERAAAVQELVSQVLSEGMEAASAELRKLGKGRTAVNGYAPVTERTKLVDQAG
jgi:hypothetical protein